MNNPAATESVFDSLFKFAVNQELRHKGDTKEYSNDMGLLVLHRIISESVDDDGNRQFSRFYHCRMIRFSGSGEIAQFSEKELISIPEYLALQIERKQESEDMRENAQQIQSDVYKAFGVTKASRVY